MNEKTDNFNTQLESLKKESNTHSRTEKYNIKS